MQFELVVIGTSYGGLSALQKLLPGLAADFPCAVAIAQHRGKTADGGLCEFLRRRSPLPVGEPDDKEEIVGGRVYLAPQDYHLLVERGHFALSTEAPVAFARPSINVLFETAADAYGGQVVGVVLTGASRDGARGLAKIKAGGGMAIVQDPAGAESRVMPEAAIAEAEVDRVLPVEEIAPFLNELGRACRRPSHGV